MDAFMPINRWRVAIVTSIAIISITIGTGCRAGRTNPMATAPDSLRIRQDVAFLAADALEGRGSGTAGNDSAAAYAARRFRALGLDSLGLPGYLQPFTVRPPARGDSPRGSAAGAP